MNINPLRRSPLKKKAKQHKESAPWRRKKVRLNASEMFDLRQNVYDRSVGQCENQINERRCRRKIYWSSFAMHHMEHRGRGGSDTKENCIAVCWECHDRHHKKHEIIKPHKDWQP